MHRGSSRTFLAKAALPGVKRRRVPWPTLEPLCFWLGEASAWLKLQNRGDAWGSTCLPCAWPDVLPVRYSSHVLSCLSQFESNSNTKLNEEVSSKMARIPGFHSKHCKHFLVYSYGMQSEIMIHATASFDSRSRCQMLHGELARTSACTVPEADCWLQPRHSDAGIAGWP